MHAVLLAALLVVSGGRIQGSAVRPLQQAIDRAHAGDTIIAGEGVHEGNLTVKKRLTLIGEGNAVLRGEGTGSVVTLLADSCTIRGLVIEHSGTMLVDEDAGILVKSDHNRIEENTFRDILFGMYFYHAGGNSVAGNTITGRASLGLGERGSGIHIWNANDNVFIGNVITDTRDGFYIQNASRMHIERNDVSHVRYGLHYMFADTNVFLNNRFSDNVAGAAIMYSKGIVFRGNVFVHNRGVSSFGVLFQDCHFTIADSNLIADNVVGLFFEASTDNTFRHNLIGHNDVALEMFQNSTANTFSENNFIDNINPLLLIGKSTGSHWFSGGRGNYWSGYDGYDLDGDGIGDVPMKIQNVFQYLEGRNENLRLFLYSPMSQALAAAMTAFPIIEINQEADPAPLMRPLDLPFQMPDGAETGAGAGRKAAFPLVAALLITALVIARYRNRPCSR